MTTIKVNLYILKYSKNEINHFSHFQIILFASWHNRKIKTGCRKIISDNPFNAAKLTKKVYLYPYFDQ